MAQKFKKYKVALKNPLDENVEADLYTNGVLSYGELGEKEIIVKTFKTKEQLLKNALDVKDVTEELTFTPQEVAYIKLLQEQFNAKNEDEFLNYYYLSN